MIILLLTGEVLSKDCGAAWFGVVSIDGPRPNDVDDLGFGWVHEEVDVGGPVGCHVDL